MTEVYGDDMSQKDLSVLEESLTTMCPEQPCASHTREEAVTIVIMDFTYREASEQRMIENKESGPK